MAESERAARLLEVYKQLSEGAIQVDPNRIFDAAERLVNAERDAETYHETWGRVNTKPVSPDANTSAREAAAEIEGREEKAVSA